MLPLASSSRKEKLAHFAGEIRHVSVACARLYSHHFVQLSNAQSGQSTLESLSWARAAARLSLSAAVPRVCYD